MTTKEVAFLYRNGLINPELIQGWEEKARASSKKHSDSKKNIRANRRAEFGFRTLGMLCALIAGLVVIKSNPSDFQGPPLIGFYTTSFFATICILLGFLGKGYEFKKDICALSDLLRRYRLLTQEYRPYELHMDIELLEEKARTILYSTAEELLVSERNNGVEHELSYAKRMDFKNAHAVLNAFKLCQPNQGFYLKRASERLPQSS